MDFCIETECLRFLARKVNLTLVFYSFRMAALFLTLCYVVFLSPTPSGKLNGIDLTQEVKGETEGCVQTARSLMCTESEQHAVTESKASEVFMNGSDLKSDEGSLLFTELKDSR